MYVDTSKSHGGKYTRHLLRENYRENGKVKHRTIANLSSCSDEEIASIKIALKSKGDLMSLGTFSKDVTLSQGRSIGAVWFLHEIAKRIGITDALGSSKEGKLAIWQVIARVLNQGSRLSAVRLAQSHAVPETVGIESLNEEKLYRNLDWLCDNQEKIENRLFQNSYSCNSPHLYLYDVTSSYFEGTENELAAFGYNRDKKSGKKQIVLGLLCDENGNPVTIEVFPGNTQDPQTFNSQIQKVKHRFGGKEITFVGDRGMIKSKQISKIQEQGYHFITAITKPQIESLVKQNVIQMTLFDEDLAEISDDEEKIRYILRRNPLRTEEIKLTRESKLQSLRAEVSKQTKYLNDHPRAKEDVALRNLNTKCKKLKLSKWISLSVSERKLFLTIDEDALMKESELDGCYVIKTDLKKETASKETVHDRYKDLAKVEWAFRTSKTVELEMRPIYVRLSSRTRGHALVVMLAYKIVKELTERWKDFDMTVEEGINELSSLCMTEVYVKGKPACSKIPEPRPSIQKLLDAANVHLPEVLPIRKDAVVATKRKLTSRRKNPK